MTDCDVNARACAIESIKLYMDSYLKKTISNKAYIMSEINRLNGLPIRVFEDSNINDRFDCQQTAKDLINKFSELLHINQDIETIETAIKTFNALYPMKDAEANTEANDDTAVEAESTESDK